MSGLEGEERVVGAPGRGRSGTRRPTPEAAACAPGSEPALAAQAVAQQRRSTAGLRLSNARTVRQARVIAAQRTVGNAAVTRLLEAERAERTVGAERTAAPALATGPASTAGPEPASLTELHQRARSTAGASIAAAGVPVAVAPPDGAHEVASHSTGGTLMGYTGIQGANAFTAPSLVTRYNGQIDGTERRFYGEVEPTTATDATHECYYLAAGDHHSLVPRDYWRVSPEISRLLRAGEQEHLDDARHAYDLTYGLIARRINALAGQKFGPAETPAAAEALAEAQVRRYLPDELGTDPLTWFNTLNEMLRMSRRRDARGWHFLEATGVPSDGSHDTFRPVRPTTRTRIGQVPSAEVVTYPSSD